MGRYCEKGRGKADFSLLHVQTQVLALWEFNGVVIATLQQQIPSWRERQPVCVCACKWRLLEVILPSPPKSPADFTMMDAGPPLIKRQHGMEEEVQAAR